VAHDLVTKDDHNLAMEKMAGIDVITGLKQELHKLQTMSVTSKSEMDKKL